MNDNFEKALNQFDAKERVKVIELFLEYYDMLTQEARFAISYNIEFIMRTLCELTGEHTFYVSETYNQLLYKTLQSVEDVLGIKIISADNAPDHECIELGGKKTAMIHELKYDKFLTKDEFTIIRCILIKKNVTKDFIVSLLTSSDYMTKHDPFIFKMCFNVIMYLMNAYNISVTILNITGADGNDGLMLSKIPFTYADILIPTLHGYVMRRVRHPEIDDNSDDINSIVNELMSGFGITTDNLYSELMKRLKIEPQNIDVDFTDEMMNGDIQFDNIPSRMDIDGLEIYSKNDINIENENVVKRVSFTAFGNNISSLSTEDMRKILSITTEDICDKLNMDSNNNQLTFDINSNALMALKKTILNGESIGVIVSPDNGSKVILIDKNNDVLLLFTQSNEEPNVIFAMSLHSDMGGSTKVAKFEVDLDGYEYKLSMREGETDAKDDSREEKEDGEDSL